MYRKAKWAIGEIDRLRALHELLTAALTELVALEDELHPNCPDAEACAAWQVDSRERDNAAWARARAALAAAVEERGQP